MITVGSDLKGVKPHSFMETLNGTDIARIISSENGSSDWSFLCLMIDISDEITECLLKKQRIVSVMQADSEPNAMVLDT